MAPACASPMLTPGYTAGGYWEDGVSLRVVANGEWVGGEGASKLEHRRRGGIPRIQERDCRFVPGTILPKKGRPFQGGLTEYDILQIRCVGCSWGGVAKGRPGSMLQPHSFFYSISQQPI